MIRRNFLVALAETRTPEHNEIQRLHVAEDSFYCFTLQIAFKEPKQCAFLCEKEYKEGDAGSERKIRLLQKGMKLNYQHHWQAILL